MPPRQGEEHPSDPYDVLVVGSGFGGSVTALRLAEKGYRVGVLEAGRRFTPETLPRTSWDIRNFLWAPRLGCYGIQRIHVLRDVLVLAGAGVGGGSLNYANTLYRPKNDAFYRDPQWASHDRLARRAGRVLRPGDPHARRRHAAVGDAVGRGDAPGRGRARARGHGGPDAVGVYFGEGPGVTSPDPFFGGAGPARTGCLECGECMTGCRHGAKNTLQTNYLALAERAGATVHPETTVRTVRPPAGG